MLEKDVADRPVLVYYSDDLKHTIKGYVALLASSPSFPKCYFFPFFLVGLPYPLSFSPHPLPSPVLSSSKIMVSDIKDVRQNATGKAFCFGLVTESRVYWFQTDSEINYSKWTISIKANSALKMS